MTPRRALLTLLLAILAMGGLGATPALAGSGQISIMLDDDQLLYRGDAERDFALNRMKILGVDYARVSILWSVVAENARKTKRDRRRFRADDPSTYPAGNWDRYDRLVRAAERIGIGLYFNVTGPGPSWGHGKAPRSERANRRTWKPKPREYFKFVKAVGARYSGAYRDENDEGAMLPRISFWSIYNEPNQGGWLTPQYMRRGSARVPWSPVMYRELWRYGRAALDQTGHDEDFVLAGETAPLGSNGVTSESPIRPKKFIRELFCIRPDGRRYTGAAARARQCSRLRRVDFRTSAWAHHPYTKKLPPDQRDSARDSISMANISDLGTLLDQMASRTGRIARGVPTILTEFGYETRPPDPFSGVSLEDQATYINEGDLLAYRDPRIVGQTQFLLRDVPPVRGARRNTKRYWFTYQSGLYNIDGSAKPSAAAYALPLVVTPSGDGVDVWGQLRFLPNGTQSEVGLEFKPEGSADFQPAGEPVPVTNPLGFFEAQRPESRPGTWRAIWRDRASGATAFSREVVVG